MSIDQFEVIQIKGPGFCFIVSTKDPQKCLNIVKGEFPEDADEIIIVDSNEDSENIPVFLVESRIYTPVPYQQMSPTDVSS